MGKYNCLFYQNRTTERVISRRLCRGSWFSQAAVEEVWTYSRYDLLDRSFYGEEIQVGELLEKITAGEVGYVISKEVQYTPF